MQEETEVFVEEQLVVQKRKCIILHNDDVNTFDYVIDCLMEICGIEEIQAEQITFIVHFKGKCDVLRGSYDELEPICTQLLNRGLSAEIE